MYSVSDKYREAIQNSNPSRLIGTILFSDGTTENINDSTIASGGVSITMQAVTGDILEFGAAVLGELNISLKTTQSRYRYYSAIITLNYIVELDGGEETIPLGKWIVSEAERDKTSLKLVAYDNLIKTEITYDGTAVEGSVYDLMSVFATNCKVELAEDQTYYESLPNGNAYLYIDEKSGCTTYRQAISILAQICGCFVQADRDGKISMRQFQTQETFSLTLGQRYGSTIADYECKYVALQATGAKGTFMSTATEVTDGLSMTIDDCPVFDYGLEATLQEYADTLMSYLETIKYTPCEVSTFSDPSIDCGDNVTLYTEDGSVSTLVTSFTWKYHNAMEFQSIGTNPYLVSTSSATNRILRVLRSEASGSKIIYYPFKNATAKKVGQKPDQIAYVSFTSTEDTSVIFQGTFQIDVQVDDLTNSVTFTAYDSSGNSKEYTITDTKPGQTNLHIYYYLNGVNLGVDLIDTQTSGSHILSLYYPLQNCPGGLVHKFAVWMSIDGGTANIPKEGFIGAVSGQGLAATTKWDGTFEFIETVPRAITYDKAVNIRSLSDNVVNAVLNRNINKPTMSDVIGLIPISRNMNVLGLSDSFSGCGVVVTQQTVDFGLNEYVAKNGDSIVLNRLYVYESVEETIDSGRMCSVMIRTDDKASVEGVNVG